MSISLLIMFDTLLLRPSLHCNTPLHFTTLRYASPNYTSLHLSTLHFLSFTLHCPFIPFHTLSYPFIPFHTLSYLKIIIKFQNFGFDSHNFLRSCSLQRILFFLRFLVILRLFLLLYNFVSFNLLALSWFPNFLRDCKATDVNLTFMNPCIAI